MRRTQLLYDGLWRCLCPALDRRALSAALQQPNLGRPARRRPITNADRCATRPALIQARRNGTDASAKASAGADVDFEAKFGAKREDKPIARSAPNQDFLTFGVEVKRNLPPSEHPEPQRQAEKVVIKELSEEDSAQLEKKLLSGIPPSEEDLQSTPIEDLKAVLRIMRDPGGYSGREEPNFYDRIIQLVTHLLRTRQEPLSVFHYECMMDTMADPRGSVSGIRMLLQDMNSQSIQPTATLCHSALVALAVHPDYALREQIVHTMTEYWFPVDASASQYILLGTLRDQQYEMAYSNLMEMLEKGVRVDLWVFDIFIFEFGQHGFLDETLQLLIRRKQARSSGHQFASMAYYVLDKCSSAFHYQGTLFAWNVTVRNDLMSPSDGILDNVLATAAVEGDAELAVEAHGIISSRSRIQIHHYDTLVEAFAKGRDLQGALRMLCIMNKNGIIATRENTRPIYLTLKEDPALLNDAENILRGLAGSRKVPLEAVSVIIEALAQVRGGDAAMALYNDIETLCGQPPSLTTIQTMIVACSDVDTRRSILDLYKTRMSEPGKKPSRALWVYDDLIPACLEAGDLDVALHFGSEAAAAATSGEEHQPQWLALLVDRAIAAEDGRIWPIVDAFSVKEGDSKAAVRKILNRGKLMKQAEERGADLKSLRL